jgi:hypothetical protein
LNRPNKPGGFHHLNHQSSDSKVGIITDVFVTPANVNDHIPYIERIKHQKETLNLPIQEVGLDKGYDHIEVHKELLDMKIKTYTPLINTEKRRQSNTFSPSDFYYDSNNDTYICPANNILKYSTVDKKNRHKIYTISKKICENCSLKSQCIANKNESKKLSVPFFKEEVKIQRANYGSERYYEVQRLRKTYCEGNFATQKDQHNLKKTRRCGNKAVTEHCILSAVALNLRKMVKYLIDGKKYPFTVTLFLIFYLKIMVFINLYKNKNRSL